MEIKETKQRTINRRSWAPALLIGIVFLAVAYVAYLPALQSYFHSDDFVLLKAVKSSGPFGVWSSRESAFFRPLISLSLYVDWWLWGLSPLGYHAGNVSIHTLNALLVVALFPLLVRMFKAGSNSSEVKAGAVFSGLIFLLQPTHPEAVSWISGRTDVYCTCFCLLSFYSYLRYKQEFGRLWLVGSFLFYGCSLLCKEASLLLPLIIVALELFTAHQGEKTLNSRQRLKRLSRSAGPFFVVTAVYLVLRVCVIGKLIGGYGAAHTTFKLGQILQAALWFFCSAFLPLLPRWGYCFACLAAVGILFVLRLRQKIRPPAILVFLLVAFYLASAPALSLGGGPAPDGMSGRLVYLASAFAALTIPLLAHFLLPIRRFSVGAMALLIFVFGLQLYLLNIKWRNAGQIAQNCIADLGTTNRFRRIVILTAPDCLYPAFILRNGLPEAEQLFHPNVAAKIEIVSLVYLYQAGDSVTVSSNVWADSATRRTINLEVRPPPKQYPISSLTAYTLSGIGYEAKVVSGTKLQVTLIGRTDQQIGLFGFSNEHLQPIYLAPVKTKP